jgi:hypothetical protein
MRDSNDIDLACINTVRTLGGRVSDLRLLLRGNGLVLQGRARSYYAKQLAQEAVMKATKLPVVANEIEVLSPTAVEGNES